MTENSTGSTTLPRDFKYRCPLTLTTPEPNSTVELLQPSPPRQRLKVRRRNVSNLHAPTEHFLASVAAADLPLPTIECPPISENLENLDRYDSKLPKLQRRNSLPRTPKPILSINDKQTRENWLMRDEQENHSNRPSSSHSSNSDFSHDSSYSNSRFGRSSENESCTSPESDYSDPFKFTLVVDHEENKNVHGIDEPSTTKLNAKIHSKVRNDAPWSRAQTAHLWATYLLYLQDPTVTPFRIGASRIPPEGICYRVAREARRSWKGPKSGQIRLPSDGLHTRSEIESITPTEKHPQTYAQWPHSSSATRNNLRNLCRQRNSSAIHRFQHYLQSRSPTPFSKPAFCQTPKHTVVDDQDSNVSFHDMSVSLSISTAVTMQPDGPLIGLAQDGKRDISRPSSKGSLPLYHTEPRRGICGRTNTLGSPFSRSYGPSSSKAIEKSEIAVSGHLGSPLQFDKTHSQIRIQKRRALFDLHEESGSSVVLARPSSNNKQSFSGRFCEFRRIRNRGFSLGNESHTTQALHSALDLTPPLPFSLTWSKGSQSETKTPPRLRSPFAEPSSNISFPCRHTTNPYVNHNSNSSSSTSMHHARRSIASFDFRDRRMILNPEDHRWQSKAEPEERE